MLALLLALAGCGGTDRPRGSGQPLLGPGSALDRRCADAPASVGAGARAGQRRAGLLLGLDVGLRFAVADPDPRVGNPCAVANVAQALGVSFLREDVTWEDVEPRRGQFAWAATDRLVAAAASRGLAVLPVMLGAPRWRGADMDVEYGRYVGQVARRYGPGGAFWRLPGAPAGPPIEVLELWNEPYVANNPDALTATAYARRVLIGAREARRLAPGARFLLAAETTYQPLGGGDPRPSWLDDVLAAQPGLGAAFDGVAVHPYGATPAPYDPRRTTENQPGRVEAIHADLVAHGLGDRPLWITEVGWSTCTRDPACVDEDRQADDVRRIIALARTRWSPYVRALALYQLRQPASSPSDPTGDLLANYGLLDGAGRPKPALDVLRDATGVR